MMHHDKRSADSSGQGHMRQGSQLAKDDFKMRG